MVSTPWSDEPIEFEKAAEIGTQKVITEHSTIGIVITTDGTITDIDADEYNEAHDRVIEELLAINKPFIVLVNSLFPTSERAKSVCKQIMQKYGIPSTAVNCMEMEKEDILSVIQNVLYEFPVSEIGIILPKWVNVLPTEHYLKKKIYSEIYEIGGKISKMRQLNEALNQFSQIENITNVKCENINLGNGVAILEMNIPNEIFYKIIGEQAGIEINDEADLLPILTKLCKIQKEYEHINNALIQVEQTGYGIVMPKVEELSLEEPEIVKQGGRFGVKLRASAPSIHIECIKQKYRISQKSSYKIIYQNLQYRDIFGSSIMCK